VSPNDDPQALDPRTRTILVATIALYAIAMAALAVSGQFTFVSKTVVVPALFLVAVVTRRIGPFVRDWAVFLSVVVLFDSLRGYAYYLTVTLDRDIYMGYVIEFDRWIFGGQVGAVALQKLLWTGAAAGALDKILIVAHGSHFLVFLLLGFAIWYTRRERFDRFKLGMSLVIMVGVLGYFLVPTIPPWMAYEDFHVIPPVTRVFGELYNTQIPMLSKSFDVNPVAAMPSLHTAFPVFLTLAALATWGRRGALMIPYALAVILALVYGAEHYAADILAGIVLAAAAFVVAYRSPVLERWQAFSAAQIASSTGAVFRILNSDARRKLAVTAFLLGLSELTGQIAASGTPDWMPGARFAERELVGRSDLAHFYLGSAAYADRDFGTAVRELELAVRDAKAERDRLKAGRSLARAAYFDGDYPRAIAAFRELPFEKVAGRDGPLIAMAEVRAGRIDDAIATLSRLARAFPCNPEYAFWRAAVGRIAGAEDPARLAEQTALLAARLDDPSAVRYAAILRELGAAKPGEVTTADRMVESLFGLKR
jgi:hypothetical protein